MVRVAHAPLAAPAGLNARGRSQRLAEGNAAARWILATTRGGVPRENAFWDEGRWCCKEIPEARPGTPNRLRTDGRVGTSDPARAEPPTGDRAGTGRGKPKVAHEGAALEAKG